MRAQEAGAYSIRLYLRQIHFMSVARHEVWALPRAGARKSGQGVTKMMTIAQKHVFELVICSDKEHTAQEILNFANGENPATLGGSSWWIADYDTKKPSDLNTGVCESDPTKVHWYLRF